MFSWGHLYITYNHQSIEPLGEAVPNTEMFRRLAAMGFDDAVFRRDDPQMALRRSTGRTRRWRASPSSRSRRRAGAAHRRAARHLRAARRGQLPDAVRQGRVHGVDGRGRQLRRAAVPPGLERPPARHPRGPAPALHRAARDARPNRALAARYPLNLLTPKSHAYINSSYANIARQLGNAGEQSVTLHPADARRARDLRRASWWPCSTTAAASAPRRR